MNHASRRTLKWVAYSLELLLVYIVQSTPNLLPSFLGVKPLMLVACAISISMFEGEVNGMWFGLAAGLLMDLSASTVFGFNGLLTMIVCFVCGMLVVHLMRNNIVTAMVLGTASLIVLGLLRWFLCFALWGDPKTWYYLYAYMLPQTIYSAVLMPVAFFFNRTIATHLTFEE